MTLSLRVLPITRARLEALAELAAEDESSLGDVVDELAERAHPQLPGTPGT